MKSLVLTLFALGAAAFKSFNGYKVFRIDATQSDKLVSLPHDEWRRQPKAVDIMVAPDHLAAFDELGIDSSVMHEDLGTSIAAEAAGRGGRDWFSAYHSYEDHVAYMNKLHTSFPENSRIVFAGKSYEGRAIRGLHLWGDKSGKPAVLWHGTVHAREWVASMTVEYLTHQLISGYNQNDTMVRSFLDKYDFHIFPIVNPDGFIYSQRVDRLWRKNRQSPPHTATKCYGRDINRNWATGWDSDPRGASDDPCSEVYQGEAASDAPETQGLDGYMRGVRDGGGIRLYVDWHSYGQNILFPFGSDETLYAPELGRWTRAASLMSEAMRDSNGGGETYTFGPSGATLYPTTGTGPDHVYAVGRADFSFTIELRDTGRYGFVLPPEQIRPTAEEQWEGQKVLLALLDQEFFDGKGGAK